MITKNLKNELSIARKAAKSAGVLLHNSNSNLNKELSSTSKDIKLKADIISENLIKNILQENTQYPILAEETSHDFEGLPNTFWVVDPLDGTANYSRGIPFCCISIALISSLEPILGVVYDFNNDHLYDGSINTKATLNNEEITVSNINDKKKGILITGLPNDTDYSKEAMLTMIENFQNWRKVRMIGSAAMASVYVASGKADLYTEKRPYLWDVAAGAAILNAAGGHASIYNQNEKFQVDVHFSNSHIKNT